MRKMKKSFLLIAFILTLVICSSTFTALAETNENCHITFMLFDATNLGYYEEIEVTLLGLDGEEEYTYSISVLDSILNYMTGDIKKGAYNIALSYPEKDLYVIKDSEGQNIIRFEANTDDYTFDWLISDVKTSNEEKKENIPTDIGKLVANTGNDEADEVFNTYLKTASLMENNNDFEIVRNYYINMEDVFAKRYAEHGGDSASEEDFKKLTTLDQFLIYELYINPVMVTQYGNYDTYLSSIINWRTHVTNGIYKMLSRCGEEQAEAYRVITDWQYEHFIEHGSMYNFFTGTTSIDVIEPSEDVKTDEDVVSVEPSKTPSEDGESNETLKEEELEDEEKLGIWGETIKLLKDNALTIIILLVLVVGLFVVTIYRKRKAIDDESVE